MSYLRLSSLEKNQKQKKFKEAADSYAKPLKVLFEL